MTKNQNGHVVGYARLSKGDDLQTQLEDIQQLSRLRGLGELPLANIYTDESISAAELHGRSKHRPGFTRLMEAIRSGQVTHVLVRSTDRLIRSRREAVEVYELLARNQVSLLVLKGMDVNLDSASGRLVAGILSEIAAHEVEVQSERTKRALRSRLERGLPPTSGRVFGYTADGMELVPAEAQAVRDAFSALLAGSSLTGIARMLNATGLPTRGGKPHSHNTTRHMLRNLRYAGQVERDGRTYQLVSPTIVTEDVVFAARTILGDSSRRSSSCNNSRWVLSGLGICGICGNKVTSGSRGADKPVYQCSKGPGGKHLARDAKPVDDFMRTLVAAVVERDADDLMPSSEDPAVSEARSIIQAGRVRLEELADTFAEGILDAKAYARATAAVQDRQVAAQAVLEAHYQDPSLAAVATAQDVRVAVDALPLDRFRALVMTVFESVTLLPTRNVARTLGFQPSTVEVVLRNGKARPPVARETVTLTLPSARAARELATVLRTGGWSVDVRRGGRLVVPADAASIAAVVQSDLDQFNLTYDLDPASMVKAAVASFVDAAPELTAEQRAAVRAALA